jgi:hypothetical protein
VIFPLQESISPQSNGVSTSPPLDTLSYITLNSVAAGASRAAVISPLQESISPQSNGVSTSPPPLVTSRSSSFVFSNSTSSYSYPVKPLSPLPGVNLNKVKVGMGNNYTQQNNNKQSNNYCVGSNEVLNNGNFLTDSFRFNSPPPIVSMHQLPSSHIPHPSPNTSLRYPSPFSPLFTLSHQAYPFSFSSPTNPLNFPPPALSSSLVDEYLLPLPSSLLEEGKKKKESGDKKKKVAFNKKPEK